jgi:hypothetical protein
LSGFGFVCFKSFCNIIGLVLLVRMDETELFPLSKKVPLLEMFSFRYTSIYKRKFWLRSTRISSYYYKMLSCAVFGRSSEFLIGE